MNNSTDAPVHARARWVRPHIRSASVANPTWRPVLPFRSPCGHALGFGAVLGARQVFLVWKACR